MTDTEIEQGLISSDPSKQLNALRLLKNSIIGHEDEKEIYLRQSVLYPVYDILTDGVFDCQLQACVVLGSFAYGKFAGRMIILFGAVLLICFRFT